MSYTCIILYIHISCPSFQFPPAPALRQQVLALAEPPTAQVPWLTEEVSACFATHSRGSPGVPRGSQGTSGGAQVFCREWEQYQNMLRNLRKSEKACFLLVFLCIEILGKWRTFTEMIIWGGWKILKDDSVGPDPPSPPRLSGANTPRFSLETQSVYGMALSKHGKELSEVNGGF